MSKLIIGLAVGAICFCFGEETGDISLNEPSTELVESRPFLFGECVDVNHSHHQALMDLPSIGPKMAERIIQYRTLNGVFTSIDDLKLVKGIGDKTASKLQPLICF